MRVLLAIDHSPHSLAAVDMVAARPWPESTKIRLLTVNSPPYVPMGPWVELQPALEEFDTEVKKHADDLVASMSAKLREKGLDVETVIRDGDPRTEIVDEAIKWNSDLIVVGSHGYTGIKRLLLGSVAQHVVAHAPCSVEVVRRPLGQA